MRLGAPPAPATTCQSMIFVDGALKTLCAATIYPTDELSAVSAGTGVYASVPSPFFNTVPFGPKKAVKGGATLHAVQCVGLLIDMITALLKKSPIPELAKSLPPILMKWLS